MLMRMTQTMRLTLTAGVLALPTLALADLPPVLDRVTPDASVVIATNSISETIAGFEALAEIGLGDLAEATAVISSIGGLNMEGSAAVGMFVTEDMGIEGPDMFMVLPISDYGEFLESLGGEGNGIAEVFIEGEAAYVTNAGGGFAFVGSTQGITEEYADVNGSTAAFETMLGGAGGDAADSSTIFVTANVEQLRPMLEGPINDMIDMMEMGAEMQGQEMGPIIDMYRSLGEHLIDEGLSLTLGLGFEDAGLTLHTSAQFVEGSETANMLTGEANSSQLLGQVPNKPFLMALAVDTSGALFESVMEFSLVMQKMQAEAMGIEMPEFDPKAISGYAAVTGVPAGGIMGGLFTSTSAYIASNDPASMLEMQAQQLNSMDQLDEPMVSFDGSYTENATTIGEHEIDAWSMSMQFSDADPAMAQAQAFLPFLFGPGGLGGFATAIDGGVVTTMSQNPRLMEAALEAAINGGGMSTNESIISVSEHLPSNRTMEMYIGMDEIFNMVGAMAAMGMMPPGLEFPEGVAPIAIGVGLGDGGAHSSIFVPVEVIEFGGMMAGMMGGMGGGDF